MHIPTRTLTISGSFETMVLEVWPPFTDEEIRHIDEVPPTFEHYGEPLPLRSCAIASDGERIKLIFDGRPIPTAEERESCVAPIVRELGATVVINTGIGQD